MDSPTAVEQGKISMGGNMGTVQNAIKSNDWGWKEELFLWYAEARAEITGSKKWYKLARGLTQLKAHIELEREKQEQPYRGERSFNRFIRKRDKHICYLCHTYIELGESDIEHDIPLVRWGKTTEENCHDSHHRCNMRKGRKTANEYLGR